MAYAPSSGDAGALLKLIALTQAHYISRDNPREVLDELLTDILNLTASEYGFIGVHMAD